MARITQCDKIVAYMTEHGSITDRQATRLGIRRLASRIWDLKTRGYRIKMDLIKVKNADGSFSHVGKYSFLNVSEV